MGSITRRTYGRIMWGSSVLTTAYWYVIAAILMAVWLADTEVTFFKPEIIVPLVVGLLGLFIALWLANRERNKRITENHFYKLHILWHVWKMLGITASHLTRCQIIESQVQQRTLDNMRN